MGNIFRVLDGLRSGELERMRKYALRDEFDNIIVDSCDTCDDGLETGIQRDDEPWVIVQYYGSYEHMQIGHKKWVAKLKVDRSIPLLRAEAISND